MNHASAQSVQIHADGVKLEGDLIVPSRARGIVLFAHGSGSGRHSPRNRAVARVLQDAGLGTLLMDLLSREEEDEEAAGAMRRFDVDLLARRLTSATVWLERSPLRECRIGYFGASTGAAAALIAAAERPDRVLAVVSRGGRPDLATPEVLERVKAPTLLIVGGHDIDVLALNREAYAHLRCEKKLEIVPGATHLFEEHGTLDRVAMLARDWFVRLLGVAPSEDVHRGMHR